MNTWKILTGDVRERLAELPDQSVQCAVTSPPYFGLRDYGHAGQIGLEATPEAFVAAMVRVFDEVKRVLKDDGVLWLNLGDSYAGSWGAQSRGSFTPGTLDGASGKDYSLSARQIKAHPQGTTGTGSLKNTPGCKQKDLIGIPWMVAFALRSAGWYLRCDVIWSKPNPMPESVTDRPTKAHEYVFLLSKSARYFYDAAAIREPYAASTLRDFGAVYESEGRKDYAAAGVQNPSDIKKRIKDKQRGHGRRHAGFNERWDAMDKSEHQANGANCRSVWNFSTKPYPEAHFATFPEELPTRCILAGSRPGDLILDPFTGSGTTGAVALKLGRSFIGCELNPAYVALAEKRIGNAAPLFAEQSA